MSSSTIDNGIDLGTTNTSVATIDGTGARIIPNKGGSTTTSSAVYIDKRGRLLVGEEAKQAALVSDLDNAICEFKRSMGMGDAAKKKFMKSGKEMTPEELSAEVLKQIRTDYRVTMGRELQAAVITVPANFDNPQTNATQRAASLAGFQSAPLILEPVAASLAYGFQSKSDNVFWFVYDFGGGTFDAALMRIRDGLIQVVDHDGDNYLGGANFDWDIVEKKLCPIVRERFNIPDFQRGEEKWKFAINKLKWEAEMAKIEVCRTREPFEIWVDGLIQDENGDGVDFSYDLTPEDIEEISKPWIEKSLNHCRKTLERAGVKSSGLDRVLMVGGTTLNPWVREAVNNEFDCPLDFSVDPVTAVAEGAAILASTIDFKPEHLDEGTWEIDIDHKPVGNRRDPDIGGKINPPTGSTVAGCTIEFVDTKTNWRTGRLTIDDSGCFITELFADEKRRCEFQIELCDASGTRLKTHPEKIAYTIGLEPEKTKAVKTIGVGLANGEMKAYVSKGMELPARETIEHFTTVPLRAGNSEDQLRIPLIEGEHPRATRNHGIGELSIKGTDIRRDLPIQSPIEVTVIMDEFQQIRLQAFVPSLDEDFEIKFDAEQQHRSIEESNEEYQRQAKRLKEACEKAKSEGVEKAAAIARRIEDEEVEQQIDQLGRAARVDASAGVELDRRVRDFAAAIDEIEDLTELPALIDEAEEQIELAEKLVNEHGERNEKKELKVLTSDLRRVIEASDVELIRQYIDNFILLRLEILNRLDDFHIGRFQDLETQIDLMTNKPQAEALLSQGRRAIESNDIEGLKAANRQLISLLPADEQERAQDPRRGDIMTRY